MLKKISSGGYICKSVRIGAIALALLISFSIQASACDNSGYIGNKVWNDLDMDGKQDWSRSCIEPGVTGVTVNLYKCDGTFLKNTTTDSHGKYWFKVEPYQKYFIEFELPDGFVFSPRDQTREYRDSDANMNTGRTACTYICKNEWDCRWDAGIYEKKEDETAAVGNYVWQDLNTDGLQDENENGIESVTVKLYTCSSDYVTSTTTNSDGFYEFTNLDAGSYYIVFEAPSGYSFTAPGLGSEEDDSDAETAGKTECFTLTEGEYNEVIDAGLLDNEEIPEFPTVAIPMVAIIGMAFVFRRRNE